MLSIISYFNIIISICNVCYDYLITSSHDVPLIIIWSQGQAFTMSELATSAALAVLGWTTFLIYWSISDHHQLINRILM